MQAPRQDPVSCESCRKKKLKCTREQPCSNCVTRNTSCVFTTRVAKSAGEKYSELSHLREENNAIKDRLRRLEELLLDDEHARGAERPRKLRRVANAFDTTIPSPSATPSSSHDIELAKSYQSDAQWLEAVATRENSRLPHLSASLAVRIESIPTIVQQASANLPERWILLPPREVGWHLFTAYVEQIDPMQHVVHLPTLRGSVQQLYDRLENGGSVDPNETVLFLCILASMAVYWSPVADDQATFDSPLSASIASKFWLRQTLDIQEHVRRTSSATLATVQSYLLTAFLLYHMEGFSPKVRAIFCAGMCAAKDLGFHQTDARAPQQLLSRAEEVDKEIRRRVWWHICCTDWTFAGAGGPHEGTYMVNPKHMQVKKPRNVTDEALETMPLDYEDEPSSPTVMGYYLQRIRLSEVSRDIIDLVGTTDMEFVSMEEVVSLDNKLQAILKELPPFLQAGHKDGHGGTDRNAVLQRYMVNLALHARRSKFHLPLLLRASDPTYSFSRNACLESARAVMKLKSKLTREHTSLWISNTKLGGFIHLYFYATVVLVMDFCANRNLVNEAERKVELETALQSIEEAKQASSAAGFFLESLLAAIRKHKIVLRTSHDDDETERSGPQPREEVTNREVNGSSNGFTALDDGTGSFDLDLEELWQSYMNSAMTSDWAPLLADIQTCAWDASD